MFELAKTTNAGGGSTFLMLRLDNNIEGVFLEIDKYI